MTLRPDTDRRAIIALRSQIVAISRYRDRDRGRSNSPSIPPIRNALRAGWLTVDGWILSHTHRDCQAALDSVAALVQSERVRRRGEILTETLDQLRELCEQRAAAYRNDNTAVAVAVAAELHQFPIDAEHLLRRRNP